MERTGRHFRRKKCPRRHHINIEFGRCLAARDDLKFERNPVDHARFTGALDQVGRRDQGDLTRRESRADPAAHLPLRPGQQHRAELELRAARHRPARHDVL